MKHPPFLHRSVLSIAVLAASLALPSLALAQGCVIARGGGGACLLHGGTLQSPGRYEITVAHRWLYSDRHFRGREEETYRQEQGTHVINKSHFLDMTLGYAVNERWQVNFSVPFVYSDRTSLYEHLGNSSGQRFLTHASGIGDIRLTASRWMLEQNSTSKGNFALGLGIKAPTGDYKARDTFMRPGGPEERYVDNSIQPGDGGWGIIMEGQGFYRFGEVTTGYANFAYLINPREQVPDTTNSVPDTYLVRFGAEFRLLPDQGLSFSLGTRWEGVPAEDLIGGSEGRRRPGYAISIEPGVSLAKGNYFFNVSVPIAVERNRVRNVADKRSGGHGDAAFADYTINTTLNYRF